MHCHKCRMRTDPRHHHGTNLYRKAVILCQNTLRRYIYHDIRFYQIVRMQNLNAACVVKIHHGGKHGADRSEVPVIL